VTGVYLQQEDLAKKRVDLTQALPNVHAATVFWDIASEEQWTAMRSVAGMFGLRLADVELRESGPSAPNHVLKKCDPTDAAALLALIDWSRPRLPPPA
jgi:hypothetical protein